MLILETELQCRIGYACVIKLSIFRITSYLTGAFGKIIEYSYLESERRGPHSYLLLAK